MKILLSLYYIITYLFEPLIKVWLKIRLNNGKESPERYREKLGITYSVRPQGKLVWLHAASVGESLSIIKLIEYISNHTEWKILLTTSTKSSAELIVKKIPEQVIHQFFPMDFPNIIKKFLNTWKPDLCLILESEIWPNIIKQTSKICPLYLINARLSDRSLKKWQMVPQVASQIMNDYHYILAQSLVDFEKFKQFSERVKYLGNIKFDSDPLPFNSELVEKLENSLQNRPIWLCASTHGFNHEEENIILTQLELLKTYPNLLLFIALRHPKRTEEFIKLVAEKNLNYILHSKVHGQIKAENNIYIIDTIGELGNFYKINNIVFIGGSFNHVNGHNPIEPAHFNCAIITGPCYANFTNIYETMFSHHAAVKVEDQSSLTVMMSKLLKDDEYRKQLADNAKNLIKQDQSISEKIWQFIQTN